MLLSTVLPCEEVLCQQQEVAVATVPLPRLCSSMTASEFWSLGSSSAEGTAIGWQRNLGTRFSMSITSDCLPRSYCNKQACSKGRHLERHLYLLTNREETIVQWFIIPQKGAKFCGKGKYYLNIICKAQVYPGAKNQRCAATTEMLWPEKMSQEFLLSGRVLGDQNVGVIASAICSNGND